MRVLMICPELPTADRPGSMAPAARQFDSLRQLGLDVDVAEVRGIRVLKYLQVVPTVRRLARQVDVVHAHFGYCGWLALAATVASRRRAPLVVSFMGDDLLGTPVNANGDLSGLSRLMVRANRRLARVADHVIVKSREMAGSLGAARSSIVPNGVDLDEFRPIDRRAARQRLGLAAEGLYVLFPGNPDNPRKGFGLAAGAVAEAERLLGAHIALVRLWGVPPSQVALLMNACDAMLMTSLIEGSPNVVKEALACDLPVVGVPVGDVHELLSGVDGCAATSRDSAEIAAALAAVLRRGARSGGRRAIASRGLDLHSVALRLAGIYQSVTGSAIATNAPPPLKSTWTMDEAGRRRP